MNLHSDPLFWASTVALAEAYDALDDELPLTSDAALREFLVDHDFIEGE